MKTISQVAKLAGVSTRALQYYDEIGLLKPSEHTVSGYRLYDDPDLQRLQQILFFKELGFKLKDIEEVLQTSELNRMEAFRQQKKLLIMKRKRLDKLIALLNKLEKGDDSVMSFKEFDLSEYVSALEQFKSQQSGEILKYWGSIEEFDEFIQKVKDDESDVGRLAIQQYGSIEKYTEAMKYNLEHFSELMERFDDMKEDVDESLQKSNDLYSKLTADKTKDISSHDIQDIVQQVIKHNDANTMGIDMGENFWDLVIDSYANDTVIRVTDQKYGQGASEYIASALRYYFNK